MSRFQIELRTHNVGAERDSPLGIGFGHNFLVLVEVRDGNRRPVQQLHGFSFDRTSGRQLSFDPLGAGRLGVGFVEGDREKYLSESANHPHFVLFEGTEQEARARWNAGIEAAEWISERNLPYRALHRNSNSMAYSAARAMGFDLRGQPIDRETGRHFSAPGGSNDPRQGHLGAPRSVFEDSLRPFSGYGDHVKTPRHPSPQELQFQPGTAHPDPRARSQTDAMRARSEAMAGRSSRHCRAAARRRLLNPSARRSPNTPPPARRAPPSNTSASNATARRPTCSASSTTTAPARAMPCNQRTEVRGQRTE